MKAEFHNWLLKDTDRAGLEILKQKVSEGGKRPSDKSSHNDAKEWWEAIQNNNITELEPSHPTA